MRSIQKRINGNKKKGENLITCGKKKLPYVLSKEQLIRIVSVVDDIRSAMVISIGIFQGLRIGEIIRLKWTEIDLENGELKVLDGKNTKRYKSGYGKDRIVPINEMFLPLWKQWRAMYPEAEFVIPPFNRFGVRALDRDIIRLWQRKFQAACQKLGLQQVDYLQKDGRPRYKYHLHTLRHVCGTNLYRAGLDLYQIKEFLGHEDIETTQVYCQLAKDDLREASHRAYAYPKSRLGMPEQPQVEVSLSSDMIEMQKQVLKMQCSLMKIQKPLEVVQ